MHVTLPDASVIALHDCDPIESVTDSDGFGATVPSSSIRAVSVAPEAPARITVGPVKAIVVSSGVIWNDLLSLLER